MTVDERQDQAPEPRLWAAWGAGRFVAWAAACLLANAAVQAATFALADSLFLSVAAGSLIGVVLPCAWLARAAGGSLGDQFALDRPGAGALLWSSVAALAAFVPTSLLAEWSARLQPVPPGWERLYAEQLPRSPVATALAYASVALAAPLAEELLFRGILQRAAARLWGLALAAALAALAFALLHGEPWLLFGLIGVGLVLGGIWAATRSVTACAVAHGLHNATALTVMIRQGPRGEDAAPLDATTWGLLALSLPLLALAGAMLARGAGWRRRAPDQR